MDIEKLIKRIKCPQIQSCPMDGEYPSCKACQKSIQQEVIIALSAQQAENEKLRSEAEGMRSNWYKSVEEIQKLRAELEQVKAERDAAIECLKNKCPFCRKYLTCQGRTINNDCWEFFGLKED